METKNCIRKRILARRNELSKDERQEKSRRIERKLLALPEYREAEYVLGFLGYGSEVETLSFLEKAVLDGKKVYCPVSRPDGTMEFYRFTGRDALKEGYKGILEPSREAEIFDGTRQKNGKCRELMIMPGVVFDKKCHRMGYGMGFYDRYLASYVPDFTAAVCFSCQIVEEFQTEDHDFTPDMVLTENSNFKRQSSTLQKDNRYSGQEKSDA